jgi:hypothetical protein
MVLNLLEGQGIMDDGWKVHGIASDLVRSHYNPYDKLRDLLSSLLKAYLSTTNSIAAAVSLVNANGKA